MRTNLELAAELIAADIRNLNDIEEYCGEPEFDRQMYFDRKRLSEMVEELLGIIHRRQERENNQFSLTPPGLRFNKYFT